MVGSSSSTKTRTATIGGHAAPQHSAKRVVGGLSALQRAKGTTGAVRLGDREPSESTLESLRKTSSASKQAPTRRDFVKALPKLVIRRRELSSTDGGVSIWNRWFCSAAPREEVLAHIGVTSLRWSPALQASTGNNTTSEMAQIDFSVLARSTRLYIASACAKRLSELVIHSVEGVGTDPARKSEEEIEALLNLIDAAVPLGENFTRRGRPRSLSVLHVVHLTETIERIALLTESWKLAQFFGSCGGADLLTATNGLHDRYVPMLVTKYAAQKGILLSNGNANSTADPLRAAATPCYARCIAAQPWCSILGGGPVESVTHMVLLQLLSELDKASTPAPNAWDSGRQSSGRLQLGCGLLIEVNREWEIATAGALCEQHRLFGLPTMLRHLRRKNVSWTGLQPTSLPPDVPQDVQNAKANRRSGDAPRVLSLFPSTRHLPFEWFEVEQRPAYSVGAAAMVHTTSASVRETADTEIMKALLAKTSSDDEEERRRSPPHLTSPPRCDGGICFVAIAGDADLMTLLLWEYFESGTGTGLHSGGPATQTPSDDTTTSSSSSRASSRLSSLVNSSLRTSSLVARSSSDTVMVGGERFFVPPVVASWVPGSVVHQLGRYATKDGRPSSGPNSGFPFSLVAVFGVVAAAQSASDVYATTAVDAPTIFLCSVMEVTR